MVKRSDVILPLLPLRLGLVLPGTITPLPVGRSRSIALARALEAGDRIFLAAQKDPAVDDPDRDDLHSLGVTAVVREKVDRGRRGLMLVIEAQERRFLGEIVRRSPYLHAETLEAQETRGDSEDAHALADIVRNGLNDLLETERPVQGPIDKDCPPGLLADRVAASLDMTTDKKREILEALDVVSRLRRLIQFFGEARARMAIKEEIRREVQKDLSDEEREAVLRKQLRAIQKELGEPLDEQVELRERLERAELSKEAMRIAMRELNRLESMNPSQAEAQVARSYLETLAELPWAKRIEDELELGPVEEILEAEHHSLRDVKQRILEYMAVLALSKKPRGTILCLLGPPGVGKTSLAQSVAEAIGRPLHRVALGGVRDEAEIRGHRRTYVGAMPGRIIGAIRRAGVKNPVIVLDEIDKLGRGHQGDPGAALLEVLDPEQNHAFIDHYIEAPFDLSEALFIATANDLEGMSAPLRDRLEIIEIPGYTHDEKMEIAKKHLIAKELEAHGLKGEAIRFTDEAIDLLIDRHTREAGVRQLRREIGKVARALALERVRHERLDETIIDEAAVRRIVGRPRFGRELREEYDRPGVAAGLAYTPFGGDILFIETTRMPGKGRVEITGKLGDVMKESAHTALSFLRSQAELLNIDVGDLDRYDLHLHVPAGAIPKDGPSAGITMLTALASLFSGRKVRSGLAMTGEATLRGRVLPVGGIQSKLLAAHRAGFTTILLPKGNELDLEDLPKSVLEDLTIHLVSEMSEVLKLALEESHDPLRGDPTKPKADQVAA